MPKFSKRSEERLNTCHADLQKLFKEVIKHLDISILEGHRSLERQKELYKTGKSKTMNSKHLTIPSIAIDVAQYPIDWNDIKRFYHFVGFVRGVASQMGIKLRSGADWDGDFEIKDQTFHDLPHFELI